MSFVILIIILYRVQEKRLVLLIWLRPRVRHRLFTKLERRSGEQTNPGSTRSSPLGVSLSSELPSMNIKGLLPIAFLIGGAHFYLLFPPVDFTKGHSQFDWSWDVWRSQEGNEDCGLVRTTPEFAFQTITQSLPLPPSSLSSSPFPLSLSLSLSLPLSPSLSPLVVF